MFYVILQMFLFRGIVPLNGNEEKDGKCYDSKRLPEKRRRATDIWWRPVALPAFREADKIEADFAVGRTTREYLLREGCLFTSEAISSCRPDF